jgi:hypothetical protein
VNGRGEGGDSRGARGRRYSRRWDTDQRRGGGEDAQFGSDLLILRLQVPPTLPPPPQCPFLRLVTIMSSERSGEQYTLVYSLNIKNTYRGGTCLRFNFIRIFMNVDSLSTETASGVVNKEKNTIMLFSVDWGKMNNEKS